MFENKEWEIYWYQPFWFVLYYIIHYIEYKNLRKQKNSTTEQFSISRNISSDLCNTDVNLNKKWDSENAFLS